MILKFTNSGAVALGLLVALGTAGCESTHKSRTSSPYGSSASSSEASGSGSGSTANTAMGGTGSGSAAAGSSSTSSSWSSTGDGHLVSSLALPTGNKSTSAILLEKKVPAQVAAGTEFTYEMRVSNLTNLTLEGVTAADQLGTGFQYVSSTPTHVSNAAGKVTWNVGDLAPKASRTISVKAKATSPGTIQCCSEVNYNTSLCAQIAVVEPKLNLAMDMLESATPCDEIPVQLRVTNSGSGTVQNAQVMVQMDAGLTVDGKTSATLNAGNLSAGQSKKFDLMAKADRTGRLAARANAEAAGGLKADAVNDSVMITNCALAITGKGPQNLITARAGRYEFTVTNNGDGAAKKATLEVSMPSGMTFSSATDGGAASGGKVRWSLGDMAPGGSKTVSATLKATRDGMVTVTGTANAVCCDPKSATVQTSAKGLSAIRLEVIDLEDQILVGDPVTYEIKVDNQGTANDENIEITVQLDEGVTFISGDGSTTVNNTGSVVTMSPVPTLAPGQLVKWNVTVRSSRAGDLRFKVQLNSRDLSSGVDEEEPTTFYN